MSMQRNRVILFGLLGVDVNPVKHVSPECLLLIPKESSMPTYKNTAEMTPENLRLYIHKIAYKLLSNGRPPDSVLEPIITEEAQLWLKRLCPFNTYAKTIKDMLPVKNKRGYYLRADGSKRWGYPEPLDSYMPILDRLIKPEFADEFNNAILSWLAEEDMKRV